MKIILKVLRPFYFLFINIFPKQQNGFIFFIEKPTIERCLQPWLYLDSNNKKLEVDKNWVKKYYSKFRNKK